MDVYANQVYPRVVPWLGLPGALLPFSLAEWSAIAALTLALALAVRSIGRLLRQGGVRKQLGNLTSWGLALSLPFLAWGYLSWGLLYSAPDLAWRAGWVRNAPAPDDPTEELLDLCRQAVELTNLNYREAVGSGDAGFPSEPRRNSSHADLDRSLELGLSRAAPLLGLVPPRSVTRSKGILLSGLLSHLGIAGFYSPWTAEANYNRWVPACSRVHAIAHEKAHQYGVAREDEANFAGFLGCVLSGSAYPRYSGYLFAQLQLLSEVALRRPEEWRSLAASRLPGVERDLRDLRAFWAEYEGGATRVSRRVNDSYLKFQGIEEGIRSYRRSVRFLVLFARSNGGRLQPPGG